MTDRKTEIQRVIEQLEIEAQAAIKSGMDAAARIHSLIDQMKHREIRRIEQESSREISLGL